MSRLIDPYQKCPVCKARTKVVFRNGTNSTLVFEPHYQPNSSDVCPHSGKKCQLETTTKNVGVPSMVPINTAKQKCKRCWQMVPVVTRDQQYVLDGHDVVSGRAPCPGSYVVVKLP